jgi:hypothetical protein
LLTRIVSGSKQRRAAGIGNATLLLLHARHQGPDIFVVEDATKDERFSDNPLVIGDPQYTLLRRNTAQDRSGQRIGTLCVLDHKPHQALDEADAESSLPLLSRHGCPGEAGRTSATLKVLTLVEGEP